MTRRHADVAAIGFTVNAAIMLLIGTVGLAPPVLIAAMGTAGFLSGMIMPSRDMLVRAAAPAGAVGRAFGIVSIGLSTGGMIGPSVWLDHGFGRAALGVRRHRRIHDRDRGAGVDRRPWICQPAPAAGFIKRSRVIVVIRNGGSER
jgi:hypothetical protein